MKLLGEISTFSHGSKMISPPKIYLQIKFHYNLITTIHIFYRSVSLLQILPIPLLRTVALRMRMMTWRRTSGRNSSRDTKVLLLLLSTEVLSRRPGNMDGIRLPLSQSSFNIPAWKNALVCYFDADVLRIFRLDAPTWNWIVPSAI